MSAFGSLSFTWKFVYVEFASKCLFLCNSTAKARSSNTDQRMPYQGLWCCWMGEKMSCEPAVRAAKFRSVMTEEWKLHTLGMSAGGSTSIPELKRTTSLGFYPLTHLPIQPVSTSFKTWAVSVTRASPKRFPSLPCRELPQAAPPAPELPGGAGGSCTAAAASPSSQGWNHSSG